MNVLSGEAAINELCQEVDKLHQQRLALEAIKKPQKVKKTPAVKLGKNALPTDEGAEACKD